MLKVRKNGQQKTCNKKRATCLATLLQNELNSDVTRLPPTVKPVINLICCKTGLMWVVKRVHLYSTRFAAMLQEKLHVFCFRFFRTLNGEGNENGKKKINGSKVF